MFSVDLPKTKERMEEIKTARDEIKNIMAERRAQEALTKNIPPTDNQTYKLEDKVFLYSKKTEKGSGPFTLIHS